MNRQPEITALVDQVKSWPVEDRVALAYEILRDMRRQPLAAPPRGTAKIAVGLGRAEGPPPSDEDVKRWIAEERVNKYGR